MQTSRSNYSATKENWNQRLEELDKQIELVDEESAKRDFKLQSSRLKASIYTYNGNAAEYMSINERLADLEKTTQRHRFILDRSTKISAVHEEFGYGDDCPPSLRKKSEEVRQKLGTYNGDKSRREEIDRDLRALQADATYLRERKSTPKKDSAHLPSQSLAEPGAERGFSLFSLFCCCGDPGATTDEHAPLLRSKKM